jgi:hypothetical protein
MYGGGYLEVMDYGAIDAFPNPGYGTATGMQDDDILVQKMADVMQNQFGLKPKIQGPDYMPPFPKWYYRVIVTTQESRCVNFAKNLKLFVCFGVLSIFEPKLLATHQILHQFTLFIKIIFKVWYNK